MSIKTRVVILPGVSILAGNAAQLSPVLGIEDDNKLYVNVQNTGPRLKRGILLEWVIIFYEVKTLSNANKTSVMEHPLNRNVPSSYCYM